MTLPQYADLGKIAKDLFNKGFNPESVKLEAKTKNKSGNDISFQSEYKNNKLLAMIESKYKNQASGLTLVNKLGLDNSFITELILEDTFLKGLKLVSDASLKNGFTFSTESTFICNKNLTLKGKYCLSSKQKQSFIFKSTLKQDNFLINTDIDLNGSNPFVHNTIVAIRSGWLFGTQTYINIKNFKLIKNNLSICYQDKDFIVHTYANNRSEFGSYLYKLLNENVELGVSLLWPSKNQVQFGLATKYKLGKKATLQAKINNSSQINLAYSKQLREGVKLLLSANVDGKNLNGGAHKLGLGIEISC